MGNKVNVPHLHNRAPPYILGEETALHWECGLSTMLSKNQAVLVHVCKCVFWVLLTWSITLLPGGVNPCHLVLLDLELEHCMMHVVELELGMWPVHNAQ